jgi:hypothetical protein
MILTRIKLWLAAAEAAVLAFLSGLGHAASSARIGGTGKDWFHV